MEGPLKELLFVSLIFILPIAGYANPVNIVKPETRGVVSDLEVSPYQDGHLESLFWKKKPIPKKNQRGSAVAFYAHEISNAGEWIHLRFKFLAPLSRVELHAVTNDLNVLEAYALTNDGQKLPLKGLVAPVPLKSSLKRSTEDLSKMGRVRSVVLRVQSPTDLAGLGIVVFINDSPYWLDWERLPQRP